MQVKEEIKKILSQIWNADLNDGHINKGGTMMAIVSFHGDSLQNKLYTHTIIHITETGSLVWRSVFVLIFFF